MWNNRNKFCTLGNEVEMTNGKTEHEIHGK